jgi:hypothetical protein
LFFRRCRSVPFPRAPFFLQNIVSDVLKLPGQSGLFAAGLTFRRAAFSFAAREAGFQAFENAIAPFLFTSGRLGKIYANAHR